MRICLCILALTLFADFLSGTENCYRIMDLCFLIDASSSVCQADPTYKKADMTCRNWQAIIDFMIGTVQKLDIGPYATRVGVVIFATKGARKFNMTRYTDKPSLIAAISRLEFTGGKTNTPEGLNVMMNLVFAYAFGDRPNATNVGLIITDGKASDLSEVPPAINRVHDANVTTFAIGITSDIDRASLKQLASDPKLINKTYFMVPDFNILDNILPAVETQICRDTPIDLDCVGIMDLCFLVDTSASICGDDKTGETCVNWHNIIGFIHRFVEAMDIESDASRVAVVTFATKGHRLWNLTGHMDMGSLLTAIDKIKFTAGSSNISDGLMVMKKLVFKESFGDRPNVANVAIVLTDARATDPSTVQSATDQVHAANITTFAVGVANKIDEITLKKLSSEPKEANVTYFPIGDFGMLSEILESVKTQICNGSTTKAKPATV